jgi:hypothetical protein
MKLLSCIHNSAPRLMHLGVAAGDREVARGSRVEREIGEAIGGEVILNLLRLGRDDLGELEQSAGHCFFRLFPELSELSRNARGTQRHKRD